MTTTAPQRLDPGLVKLAGVVILGALMSALDTTVVNVGIDVVAADLHASLPTAQWVSTSYLLALALVVPLSGWAVDRLGAKRVWLLSLTLFLIGSALCGMAGSIGQLIAFRALQGLGGGLLMPVLQTILAQAAGPARMGRLMSLVTIPVMLAPVFGPVLAGVVIDAAGWPWIFYLNLPVGVIALALAWFKLPAGTPKPSERLDWLGFALLSPGLAAAVYGLSSLGEGKPAVALGWLAVAAALIAAVTWHMLRTPRKPLLDLRLFARREFRVSALGTFLLGAALFGTMFVLPLFYQQAQGRSAIAAGLLLVPQGIGVAICSPFAGRLTDRFGARTVVPAGVIALLLGTLPFTQLGSQPPDAVLIAALTLRGFGLGATMMPTMTAAYQVVSKDLVPRAATLLNICQRVGGSVGTALLAVVLHWRITAGSGQLAPAFSQTFWWSLGLSALALVPALSLPNRPHRTAA